MSNGCYACDALIGEFFLFHEELPHALAEAGAAGLDSLSLGLYAIPTLVYNALARRAYE